MLFRKKIRKVQASIEDHNESEDHHNNINVSRLKRLAGPCASQVRRLYYLNVTFYILSTHIFTPSILLRASIALDKDRFILLTFAVELAKRVLRQSQMKRPKATNRKTPAYQCAAWNVVPLKLTALLTLAGPSSPPLGALAVGPLLADGV